MKKSSTSSTDSAAAADSGSRTLLPALIAVGGSLAALPAGALELGEAKVSSSLGQPLRASIAYALGPNEALFDSCVTLQRGMSASGLPPVRAASINVADGVISVTGKTAVRDPLMSMRVNVRCPYTPRLSREYMLFVDPAQPASEPVVAPAAATAAAPTVTAAAPTAIRRRTVSSEPIDNATRYRVQPGDSLSQIAQRIENRPVGLWDAVAAIFDANPDAFINDDPNMLKAGSWLSIPAFGAAEPVTVADNNVFSSAPVDVAPAAATAHAGSAYPGVTASESASAEAAVAAEPAAVAASEQPSAEVTETSTAGSSIAELQPGDIILDSDNAYVTTGDDTATIIPDMALEGPTTTSSSPNVPTAAIRPPSTEPAPSNWLLWLAGAGLAIIAALLLFGRRVRERFGSTPIAAVATPQRRQTDGNTQTIEAVSDIEVEMAALGLSDDSPTEENLALDADLVIGTGLQAGTDVDVAQDFGFAATTDLDLELPEEMSSGGSGQGTDIIEPLYSSDEKSILECEVLPEDDDYEMSVIMDATKMPQSDDVTERDLEAIAVETSDETLIADDYTVSHEVDYTVLEQDYEDEMTATQALNQEIAKAAAELTERTDQNVEDGGDDTSAMSMASVTELDITAQLEANNDEISDLDDTGVNEAVTVSMSGEEKTAEMPARDSEPTVDMDVKKRTGSG